MIEHPPYSPNLAMCDFWLFFYPKKNLLGRRFHSEEVTDGSIVGFFSLIPKNEWFEALNMGKFRL